MGWILDHWYATILPVSAGLTWAIWRAVAGWTTSGRPARPAGISHKAADELISAAEAREQAAVKRIDAEAKAARDKINLKFGPGGAVVFLVCAGLALAAGQGCASHIPQADLYDVGRNPAKTLAEICESDPERPGAVLCPREGFRSALVLTVDLWATAAKLAEANGRQREAGEAMEAAAAGDVAQARQQLADAKAARWTWAAAGFGTGAALTTIILGLAIGL